MDYLKLISGSDIRGVASAGMPGQNVTLTPAIAAGCAVSYAEWLARYCGKSADALRISVGRDCRLSSPALAEAVMGALYAAGVQVMDCEGCTTPAMFMTTVDPSTHCDGAIMITASHLPWNRNGLKFFTADGGLTGEDITEILKNCKEADLFPAANTEKLDYLTPYSAKLRSMLSADGAPVLKGLKIVVDAGNGMGGFYARKVLEPLGADVSCSVCLEQDGHFPVHMPNPEDTEAMDCICRAVRESHADLGIIFDTDCDRAAVVDADGKEINRNRLIALLTAVIQPEYPGCTIVTDSVTSSALTEFIEALGCVHRRYKRGYNNVIGEAKRLNAPVAIETSGHCALSENYYLDDGAYLVTRILQHFAKMRMSGQHLSGLIADLKEPVEEQELRLKILCDDFRSYGSAVIEEIGKKSRAFEGFSPVPDNTEGVRVNTGEGLGQGWFLLRQSVHDPVLPLNIESFEKGGVIKIVQILQDMLKGYKHLDIKAINDFIQYHESI